MGIKTLIIGNGFDLDLGLKTSYSNFMESSQFKSLLTDENRIADYLQDQYRARDCGWVDIENELSSFAKNRYVRYLDSITTRIFGEENRVVLHDDEKVKVEARQIFKKHVEALRSALFDYLLTVQSQFNVGRNRNTNAYNLILKGYLDRNSEDEKKGNIRPFDHIYSFNYTNSWQQIHNHIATPISDIRINVRDGYMASGASKFHHVHGSLAVNEIVFGVEDNAIATMDFPFLFKSHHHCYRKSPDVSNAIISSKEVHFFGCALGATDTTRFQKAFMELSENNINKNYLTQRVSRPKLVFYIYNNYDEIYNRILELTGRRVTAFFHNNDVSFIDLKTLKECDGTII